MNTKQLQYVISLFQTRNFSQVADAWGISQPALSKQILSLEKELGVKLFDRSCMPLSPTPAGEHFVREAQQLLYREEQLLRSMEAFQSGEKGRLTIGISPFRNLHWMPGVVRQIRERYPGVQVVLHETNSERLRKEAAEGKYDFSIVNLPVDESVLDIRLLEPETLVLAVPKAMAEGLPRRESRTLPEITVSDCRKLPFIMVAQPQEMRQYFDRLCAAEDFSPQIAVEVSGGVTTAWSMARAGLGATLLPLPFVVSQELSDELCLFSLSGDKGFFRQPAIVTRRGQYLSEYAQYAIELCLRHPGRVQAEEK